MKRLTWANTFSFPISFDAIKYGNFASVCAFFLHCFFIISFKAATVLIVARQWEDRLCEDKQRNATITVEQNDDNTRDIGSGVQGWGGGCRLNTDVGRDGNNNKNNE